LPATRENGAVVAALPSRGALQWGQCAHTLGQGRCAHRSRHGALMLEYVLTLLAAAAVTYLLTPLVRRFAMAVGAMHAARDRDVHVVPTPLLGGFAMYAGLIAGLLVSSRLPALNSAFAQTNMAKGLLLAGGLIVVMGFVDDRWGMGALSKLAGQVAAGVILVWSGAEVTWLPVPGGGTLGLTSDQQTAVTILVVVMTINAVNFIDGLDGLAAGIVGIGAAAFFIYYYTLTHRLGLPDQTGPALASAVLAGMCLGFLPHNFYPARIFMGDTGSMLIGLLLAYTPISSLASLDPGSLTDPAAYASGTVNRFGAILPLLLPAAILLIPYADLLMAVVRRTRAGMSPFAPDRQHLHHRLLAIGHSHRASVLIMYLWATLFAGSVVWLSIVQTPLFVLAIVTVAAMLALLLVSMPRLRVWSWPVSRGSTRARRAARAATAPARTVPAGTVPAGTAPAVTPSAAMAAGALGDGFLPTPPAYVGSPDPRPIAPAWPVASRAPATAPIPPEWPPASAAPPDSPAPSSSDWAPASPESPSEWAPASLALPSALERAPAAPESPSSSERGSAASPMPLPSSERGPGVPESPSSSEWGPVSPVPPDVGSRYAKAHSSAPSRSSPPAAFWSLSPPAFGSPPAAAGAGSAASGAPTESPGSPSGLGRGVGHQFADGQALHPGPQRGVGSPWLSGLGDEPGSDEGSRGGPQRGVGSPWLSGLGDEPAPDEEPRPRRFSGRGRHSAHDTAADGDAVTRPLPPARASQDPAWGARPWLWLCGQAGSLTLPAQADLCADGRGLRPRG
jgi:UDP-GlcNAc:undecaprenyl-phosphate GlcNAc-1-phosphate transferase